jgi:hypothetical protein
MSVLKSDAALAATPSPRLADHYRAIGPAHILAAVLAIKTKQPKTYPASVLR